MLKLYPTLRMDVIPTRLLHLVGLKHNVLLSVHREMGKHHSYIPD